MNRVAIPIKNIPINVYFKIMNWVMDNDIEFSIDVEQKFIYISQEDATYIQLKFGIFDI